MDIKEINVGVSWASNKDGQTITYSCSAKVRVEKHQCPAVVWNETLAWCQDKVLNEIERIEKGEPPRKSVNVYNEDFVPDFSHGFKPHQAVQFKS